jgi:hypothetical protein
MPDCHQCRFNLKGNRRCLKCTGQSKEPVFYNKIHCSQNHHGKNHCSFENIPESELAKMHIETTDQETKLTGFFRWWLSCPKKKRHFVADLITHPNRNNSKLAGKYKMSRQAVSIKIRRLIKEIPEIKTMLKLRMKGKAC